jgi:hypothetical protein
VIDARQRGDPLALAIWFLAAEAGHGGCGGWTFHRHDMVLRCICGTALYEFRVMDQHRGGPSASPAGPARKAATE